MSETQWDFKLKAFLKKTGDDFKRAGAEMKVEAERLMAEAKDPERAKKIKEGLNEVGTWAKKTAEELAGLVETGVKKAEVVFKEAVVTKPVSAPAEPTTPTAAAPAAPARKTVGRGPRKSTSSKKTSAKKPLGRAKRPT
jgi:hypothetical protein